MQSALIFHLSIFEGSLLFLASGKLELYFFGRHDTNRKTWLSAAQTFYNAVLLLI